MDLGNDRETMVKLPEGFNSWSKKKRYDYLLALFVKLSNALEWVHKELNKVR
jgi:hypothetical protein